MSIEHYDVVIFGGGKAGKTLAADQAKAGKSVALIERGMIGGSCINVACIPSKTLIRSAQVAGLVATAAPFGVEVEASHIDMPRVAARTAAIVQEMAAMNLAGFKAAGFELVIGWGRFVEPRVIEAMTDAGPRRISGDRIYLNLGTIAAMPEVPGLIEAKPLTHVEALKLSERPEHLLVIGGGYIGLELGQAFRKLGSRVTILDHNSRVAAREDEDVAAGIRAVLEADGIDFLLEARDAEVSGVSGDGVSIRLGDGRSVSGSHILVAAGRTPMTGGIGLEIAGVDLDARGFVVTDETLRTSADGIWAMGEIAGTPMFTHASLDDFRVIKSGLAGGSRTTSGRTVPYSVFIDPEFARYGVNENEAKAQGTPYRIAKLPMDVVPRARTLSERQGMMKALIGDDDRILGFMMLGAQAGEIMTAVQFAMLGGLPYTALRDAIIAHPTLVEGLNMLFANVQPAA